MRAWIRGSKRTEEFFDGCRWLRGRRYGAVSAKSLCMHRGIWAFNIILARKVKIPSFIG